MRKPFDTCQIQNFALDLEVKSYTKSKNFLIVGHWRCPPYKYLIVRKIEITNTCHLCNQSMENIDLIFRKCIFVQGIWDRAKFNCPCEDDFFPLSLKWYAKTTTLMAKFSPILRKNCHYHI